MAISCYERYKGRSGTLGFGGEDYSIEYVVQGTTDSAVAVAAVMNQSPPAVVGVSSILNRQPLKFTDEGGASGIWYFTADYKPAGSDEDKRNDDDQATPLAYKLSWDTGGGTVKVTQSIDDPDGAGAPANIYRFIGWDGRKVNGCDIYVPQLNITVDVFYAPAFITKAVVCDWARNTGKVNSDSWLGFAPGECLFMGCTGEQTFSMLNGKATKPVPVSFKIGCSQNIPGPFKIKGDPDLIANGGKAGWDYLDVYYGEKKVGTAPNELSLPVPEWFRIHKVYYQISFSKLTGID